MLWQDVCPSATRPYSVEMSKHIVKGFLTSARHVILVFPDQTLWQYSDGEPPNEEGMKKS